MYNEFSAKYQTQLTTRKNVYRVKSEYRQQQQQLYVVVVNVVVNINNIFLLLVESIYLFVEYKL